MKDHDFHAIEMDTYPWRVDIPIAGDLPFSATTADLNLEDAKKQGQIFLRRFKATSGVLTPIIVSRRMSDADIDDAIRRLTTTLTLDTLPQETSMLDHYDYQDLPELKRINVFIGSDDFLSHQGFRDRVNRLKKFGALVFITRNRVERTKSPVEQMQFVHDIIRQSGQHQYILATHSDTILKSLQTHLEIERAMRQAEDDGFPVEVGEITPLCPADLAVYGLHHKNKIIQFKNLLDPKTGLISPEAFPADQIIRDRQNLINSICPK